MQRLEKKLVQHVQAVAFGLIIGEQVRYAVTISLQILVKEEVGSYTHHRTYGIDAHFHGGSRALMR